MKKIVVRKKVKVMDNTFIAPLSIQGPIDRPIMLRMEQIKLLVLHNYKVFEVLKDGREVRLDAGNYNKNNGGSESSAIQAVETQFTTGHKNDSKVETVVSKPKLTPAQIRAAFEASKNRSKLEASKQNSNKNRGLNSLKSTTEVNKTKLQYDNNKWKKNKHKADPIVEK